MVSIVKSVQANGSGDSPHGTLYNFVYEFEDGVSLGARHKTVTGFFKEGSQVEYNIKGENTYGNYGTVSKPKDISSHSSHKEVYGPGAKVNRDPVQTYIVRQSSLKIALEHLSVVGEVNKENVIALAEYYVDYVFDGL